MKTGQRQSILDPDGRDGMKIIKMLHWGSGGKGFAGGGSHSKMFTGVQKIFEGGGSGKYSAGVVQ